ncbi:MAG: hypothetical protein ER33_05110 [Cyanobium sp. CACIAM 14]|nr:MAG: hypothetical protein ER33_05110 [Cyanobium sp. CACIAM 14]
MQGNLHDANTHLSRYVKQALVGEEVVIKASLGRTDFKVDAAALRLGLLGQGFRELPIRAEHALAVQGLPSIHRNPFDRLLVVQAKVEQVRLLSADRHLAAYGDPVEVSV